MGEYDVPHILLVEDDADLLDALAGTLSARGFAVATARNGQDALDQLVVRTVAPDVILLDLQMPRMDGREFLQRRRDDGIALGIPVVVFTADPPGPIEGADVVLPKPTPAAELVAVIKTLLGRQAAA